MSSFFRVSQTNEKVTARAVAAEEENAPPPTNNRTKGMDGSIFICIFAVSAHRLAPVRGAKRSSPTNYRPNAVRHIFHLRPLRHVLLHDGVALLPQGQGVVVKTGHRLDAGHRHAVPQGPPLHQAHSRARRDRLDDYHLV